MKPSSMTRAAAATFAVLGLALTGCGSDAASDESSTAASTSESSSAEPTSSTEPTSSEPTSPAAAEQHESIADYLKSAGIVETQAKRGDPGTPTLDLPIPTGWEDAGPRTPEYAWGAIFATDPAFLSDPPSIVAIMSRLTGPVEAAKIFEYAPGELNNLPGWDGPTEAKPTTLGGFDAVQIGGTYVKDGQKRLIAQKTVVIPPADGNGLFVLQLNAEGTEEQMGPLMDATLVIDDDTTITP